MNIAFFNTKNKIKENFIPIDNKNIRMYVCGPTVYDRAHIGNARPAVVFDLLFRFLRHVYGTENVTYVRNFTDIDDKINKKAKDTGRNIRSITDETIKPNRYAPQSPINIFALGKLKIKIAIKTKKTFKLISDIL